MNELKDYRIVAYKFIKKHFDYGIEKNDNRVEKLAQLLRKQYISGAKYDIY